MKNKIITFDSRNIFLSIKKLIIYDIKFLLIISVVSLILSSISFDYYEKNKTYFVTVAYTYDPELNILGEVKIISHQSFTNFANKIDTVKFNIYYDSFPKFEFYVNDEILIKEVNIEIEKLLNDYIKYLIDLIKYKINFLEKNDISLSNQEINKLKYTLLLLNNDNIFYDKQISIKYPDKIGIFFFKFFSLIFLSLFFIRFIFLFFQRKIKLL